MEKRKAGNDWERNLEDKHREKKDRKVVGNKAEGEVSREKRQERSGKASWR
jgi:hypothetical protein